MQEIETNPLLNAHLENLLTPVARAEAMHFVRDVVEYAYFKEDLGFIDPDAGRKATQEAFLKKRLANMHGLVIVLRLRSSVTWGVGRIKRVRGFDRFKGKDGSEACLSRTKLTSRSGFLSVFF